MGTVGAPLSTPKRPGGSPGAIARIAELGLGALELGWVQSVRVGAATCAAIRAASEHHEVALSVHAPYYINFNASSAEVLDASARRLLDAARAGALAGATDIIFHPGGYMDASPARAYAAIRDRIREVRDRLRDEGVAVTLRPETTGRAAMFGTLEECVRLSAELDGIAPCIDFAHLYARNGVGASNSREEFSAALELVRSELGQRAIASLHIHLSGIAWGPRGEKHHLPLEESELRYRELLEVLRDSGAAGRILCESPIMEEDALRIQEFLGRPVTRTSTKRGPRTAGA